MRQCSLVVCGLFWTLVRVRAILCYKWLCIILCLFMFPRFKNQNKIKTTNPSTPTAVETRRESRYNFRKKSRNRNKIPTSFRCSRITQLRSRHTRTDGRCTETRLPGYRIISIQPPRNRPGPSRPSIRNIEFLRPSQKMRCSRSQRTHLRNNHRRIPARFDQQFRICGMQCLLGRRVSIRFGSLFYLFEAFWSHITCLDWTALASLPAACQI